MDWNDAPSHELVDRRRRSVVLLLIGVPIMTFALVGDEPTTRRMRRREAALLAIGAFCVAAGVYDALRATLVLRRRDDIFAKFDAVSDDDLVRRRRASVVHLLLVPVVLAVARWNTRAPSLRYASFALACVLVVLSVIRIVRTSLDLRKRQRG